MESIHLKYNKEAEQKGMYIISGCGWDGISVDMGVRFLKDNFDSILNSVETYVTIEAKEKVNFQNSYILNSLNTKFYHDGHQI